MKVVGVSRIMDEADLIEPFLRHHAALFDLHILLDNGSTDATVAIVRALHAEGLPLQLYQTVSPLFMEPAYNTALYQLALAAGADWAVFADADELLQVRGAERPAEVLALVPPGVPALRLAVHRYAWPGGTHPFDVLQRRSAAPEMFKIAPARLDPARVSVSGGSHFLLLDGREEHGLIQDRLWLAHVPERGRLQMARKTVLARLKPIATGAAAAAHWSVHRIADFDRLKADPAAWLAETGLAVPEVEEPAAYRGGALRHTVAPDELARFVGLTAAAAERLAATVGELVDRKRLLRQELERRGSAVQRLL